MSPRAAITERAQLSTTTAVYVTYTVTDTAANSIWTTTLALGNSPTPTPPPTASRNPTNEAVIGAVVGSIAGFFLLLALIVLCIRRSNSDWAPALRSSSFSSIYVNNPNHIYPTVIRTKEVTETTTRVIRDTETKSFYFVRPKIRRERSTVRIRIEDSSESSQSSEG